MYTHSGTNDQRIQNRNLYFVLLIFEPKTMIFFYKKKKKKIMLELHFYRKVTIWCVIDFLIVLKSVFFQKIFDFSKHFNETIFSMEKFGHYF